MAGFGGVLTEAEFESARYNELDDMTSTGGDLQLHSIAHGVIALDYNAPTYGQLRRQLQVLKDAQLLDIEKGTSGNRPQTICRLTRTGRKRFLEYIAELERVISNAAQTLPLPMGQGKVRGAI